MPVKRNFFRNIYSKLIQHCSGIDCTLSLSWVKGLEQGLERLFDLTLNFLGPFVQSVVSLTSSLFVKMLTVLVSTKSNLQVFLLKKM